MLDENNGVFRNTILMLFSKLSFTVFKIFNHIELLMEQIFKKLVYKDWEQLFIDDFILILSKLSKKFDQMINKRLLTLPAVGTETREKSLRIYFIKVNIFFGNE